MYVKFKPKYTVRTLCFLAQNLFQTIKNRAIPYTEATDKNSSFVAPHFSFVLDENEHLRTIAP